MAKVMKKVQPNQPKIENNKSYEWSPDDIFEVTGEQFAAIYHAITQEVNNVGGTTIAQMSLAFQTVTGIFQDGVEQGVIREKVEPTKIDTITDEKVKELFNKKQE